MELTQLPPRPRWAGFSFCLAFDAVQGFCFCPDAIQPHTSIYSVFYRVNAITTNATKQRTGLYSGFSCDCTRSTAHYTRPTQAGIIPPATRWDVYTRPDALSRYQIPPPRRDAAQVSKATYYNKVYKTVQGCALVMDPCQTAQHIADHASGGGSAVRTRRSGALHPEGQSSSRKRGGRRGTIGGFRRISFRAFAR